MNKTWRILILAVLCLCLGLQSALPAAAEAPESTTVFIRTERELEWFARACRLDAYSRNLVVSLESDLDMSGMKFECIPIFCGEFQGNGHVISGLSFRGAGSDVGLFRFLTKTARVLNLTVRGTAAPEGSRARVGGIAGTNAGTIRLCRFDGEVSGSSQIGGIAGCNTVTGSIEKCSTQGMVHGDHFVGGIAGENSGVIRGCSNGAKINDTAVQNTVDLEDITLESISGTENISTVTDVGGIAGFSGGVIRQCSNQAAVGYRHMGYNIGGIAGVQQGYLTGCVNYGRICGRKEVGGIVGQMEPVTRMEYSEDALQTLREQLAGTAALANQASANAGYYASGLNSQISQIRGHAQNAQDAVDQLIPDRDNPRLPDSDQILAAKNTVTSSLGAMHTTAGAMVSTAQESVDTMTSDLQALADQISAMGSTLSHAPENLGGTVTDVSDQDTAQDFSGKISGCKNYGEVLGDLNIGGIVGAVVWENDLDPEQDLLTAGAPSLKFEGEVRAVILKCRNMVSVTGGKLHTGGIVGRQTLGLVRECLNTGPVSCQKGKYVGGIAGSSTGFIRSSWAKCQLQGESFTGGIAGAGAIVTDCRSMVSIDGCRENLGGVLGAVQEGHTQVENPVQNNFCFSPSQTLGAIDGISYEGQGEDLTDQAFFGLEDLPDSFTGATVAFLYEDGSHDALRVFFGEGVSPDQIPPVPVKEGHVGSWSGLEPEKLQHIYFNMAFRPVYEPYLTTVRSQTERRRNNPLLLAQGKFADMDHFPVEYLDSLPEVGERQQALEAWEIPSFSETEDTTLRLALPEKNMTDFAILVRHGDGTWEATPSERSGSYAVFRAEPGDSAICLVQLLRGRIRLYGWVGAFGAAAVLVGAALEARAHTRRKKEGRKS